MKAAIVTLGQLFGRLQDNNTMINLIGPMSLPRGDSATYLLTVTDDDDDAIDITGLGIELEIKSALGAADPATIRKTVGAGITLLTQSGDTLGQATIEIDSTDSDITPGLRYLDVVVIDGADRQHVVGPREFSITGVVNAP